MHKTDRSNKTLGAFGSLAWMRWLSLGLVGVLILAACSTGGGGSPQAFQLSVPEAVAAPQGCNLAFQAYVTRPAGATGEVAVSVSGLPSGVTADALTIPSSASGGTLTLRLGGATPGTADLTVRATLGSETRTGTVRLTVQPPSPEGICPDIPATTKVTDQASRQALSGFDNAGGNYTLRFSQATPVLLNLRPGDVLVSAPSERAPGGYLVKVTAVRQEGGGVVVTGTQARIEEAIHQGQLVVENHPLIPTGQVQYLVQGVQASRISPQDLEMTFRIVDVVLFDYNDGTVQARLVMNGEVRARAGLDFVLDIRGRVGVPPVYVHRFLAQGRAQLSGSFRVSGEARGRISREVPIARVPFTAITFTIGPVPVVILPSMVFSVGASGEASVSFIMGTEINNTARAGIEYLDDRPEPKWQPIFGFTQSITRIGPELRGALEARAYARGGVGVDLYGVPTASLAVLAYARLFAQARSNESCPLAVQYGLYGGMDADVSLDIATVIGLPRVWHNFNLFELRLTDGFTACPPTVRITSPRDNENVDLNRQFTVVAEVTDPMGQSVTLSWDPSPVSTSGTNATYRFTREGSQRITVTATTSDGRRNQASIQVNVVNSPPRAFITRPADGQQYYRNRDTGAVQVAVEGNGTDINEDNPLALQCTWRVTPDNLTANTCNASFTFNSSGDRTLALTVRDPQGASGMASRTIRVLDPPLNYPPSARIEVVPDRPAYDWAQTLTLMARDVHDPEGDTPFAFSWVAVKINNEGAEFGSRLTIGAAETVTWNLSASESQNFLGESGSTCQSSSDGQRVRIELVVRDNGGRALTPFTDSKEIRVICSPR